MFSESDDMNPEALADFVLQVGSKFISAMESNAKVMLSIKETLGKMETTALEEEYVEHASSQEDSAEQGTSSFCCNVCSRLFVDRISFEIHVQSHRKIKQFQCDVCTRQFCTKQALKVHAFVHAKAIEAQFFCSQCAKVFQTKQNLQNHTNIHLDVKPYKCSTCGKSFREKSTLTKHFATHKALKTYSCHFCNKNFSQASSRQRHEKKMHASHNPFGGFLPALGAEVVARELVLLEKNP